MRSRDRSICMYICIYKERDLQKEREREREGRIRGDLAAFRLEANKYRPFRWPKVGRGSRSRDKGEGGQKRAGDRDRPEIWPGDGEG